MILSTDQNNIVFSLEDLNQFSAISRDRNPLHLSADYARKTPYGEQVVFGVLGALKCLNLLKDRIDYSLSKISIDFLGPLFIDIVYQLVVDDKKPEKAVLKIYDGSRLLLKAALAFSPGKVALTDIGKLSNSNLSFSQESEFYEPSLLTSGRTLEGKYSPDLEEVGRLPFSLPNLKSKGIGLEHLTTLLCSTYLIGMRLPGKQALFSKLKLRYPDSQNGSRSLEKLDYCLEILEFDTRFQLLRLGVSFENESYGSVASGELQAFVRPILPTPTPSLLSSYLPASDRLAGKVALITGASRGLGATLAQTLASQGCTTLINYHRSTDEAQKVAAQFPEKISLMQGDVSDIEWCMTARKSIEEKYGRLDYLICNACPPIIPLRFEADTVERINTFIHKSIALVSIPMSVFLNIIVASAGWNIAISSIYTVEEAPVELSHYISAKFAIEGLLKALAMENEDIHSLLVRPPKLLTDQTNTPLGREGALSTVEISAKLVDYLLAQKSSKVFDVLEFL